MGKYYSMLLKLSASVVFILHLLSAAAQTGRIAGTVTDAEGQPLPGATIIVSGTSSGVTADNTGRFALAASEGQTLDVSFIGYKNKTVRVGAKTEIDIVLEPDDNLLQDVVLESPY